MWRPSKKHDARREAVWPWCGLGAYLRLRQSHSLFVCWLFNVPATYECISGTDLLRQLTCCHTETKLQTKSSISPRLRDGSAPIIERAATLREKLQIELSASPSHNIMTPGQPVPALTL